jgi:hypothetical protein
MQFKPRGLGSVDGHSRPELLSQQGDELQTQGDAFVDAERVWNAYAVVADRQNNLVVRLIEGRS